MQRTRPWKEIRKNRAHFGWKGVLASPTDQLPALQMEDRAGTCPGSEARILFPLQIDARPFPKTSPPPPPARLERPSPAAPAPVDPAWLLRGGLPACPTGPEEESQHALSSPEKRFSSPTAVQA